MFASLEQRSQITELADYLSFSPQPEFTRQLYEWAKGLPDSPQGIIDLSAGIGIEAKFLSDEGFKVQAIDLRSASEDNLYPVENAPCFKTNKLSKSYGGAIHKDSLIFLPPLQQEQTIQEAGRILVRGGSLLILSQVNSVHTVHILPSDSKYPIKILACDFESEEKWAEKVVEEEKKGGLVFFIEWQSMLKKIIEYANKYQFTVKKILEYSSSDTLARENRFFPVSGFLVELTNNL